MSVPKFHRVAAGDYETADGKYNLRKLIGVNPPAWNVEYGTDWINRQIAANPELIGAERFSSLIVDGAASKRDALELFADWYREDQLRRVQSASSAMTLDTKSGEIS